MMHILLIEKDIALGEALLIGLQHHYNVEWVRRLGDASTFMDAQQTDLVLLDLKDIVSQLVRL